MEEQATWRGHSFTLLVFTGIVVLCSIFFVLGMLVGRSQGLKAASVAAAEAEAKRTAASVEIKEDKPEYTFYRSVEDAAPAPVLDPEPAAAAKPEPARSEAARAPAASASSVTNFQISAVRKSADAQKLLDELKKKGFKGFILAPSPGDANPFYRIQVGPYSDALEAEADRLKLVALKYHPIKK